MVCDHSEEENLSKYYQCRKYDLEDAMRFHHIRVERLEKRRTQLMDEMAKIDASLIEEDYAMQKIFVEYQHVINALMERGNEE